MPRHCGSWAPEDEFVRAEIALWRCQLTLPMERHHAVTRAERVLAELHARRRPGVTWEGPHDT
jgi:hypothetical protein